MFKMQRTLESLIRRNTKMTDQIKISLNQLLKRLVNEVVPHKNNRILSANVGPVALKRTRRNCPQTEKKATPENKDQQMKQVACCGK